MRFVKGFFVYDSLIAMIFFLLIFVFILSFILFYTSLKLNNLKDQVVLDKLVSASEYFLTYNSKHGRFFPNKWTKKNIVYNEQFDFWSDYLSKRLSFNITVSYNQTADFCIYRLVIDKNYQIKKLYFCSG